MFGSILADSAVSSMEFFNTHGLWTQALTLKEDEQPIWLTSIFIPARLDMER